MRSLINITDLSVEELYALMDKALDIIQSPNGYNSSCRGKKIATLFFEPSTRTRLSFEAAMLELGGSVISVSGAGGSSVTKGETLADTAKVVSCYADIIAVRHPLAGSAREMSKAAGIPVFAICGSLGEGYEELYDHGIRSFDTTIDRPMTLDEAIKHARECAENVCR